MSLKNPLTNPILDIVKMLYLLLINRARGPHWGNIARGLSGMDRAKRGPYKKD